ncbi:hypothetical protein DOQ08_00825 [Marinobacter litoralis]|uniref:Uncharacterized protein n=1 Tax=Marinobacter litoralis TaxID=187981 RepID=A0A3M2RLB4_9GAMM|nr:hypothetical protein [Marinobacter litoralis]RMJ06140.1 hypothetical protein DOQ08_00825 [Marinobacter litoralis]
MVEISPYNDQLHRDQVLALFPDVPFKRDLWEYQFLLNPGAMKHNFSPVIAVNAQRVVGFNGVVPVAMLWNGQVREGLWSCDFKVCSELRGKGVGRLIKEELAQRSPILISFGISPVAAIVLERMGWHANKDVHFLKKIRCPSSVRDHALSVFQCLTSAVNWTSGGDEYSVSVQDSLPKQSDVDALWDEVKTGYDKVVVRNWSYLHWRYETHPLASYRFLELKNRANQLKAIGIVRASGGQVRLVDYMGPAQDIAVKRALVKGVLNSWSDAKAFSAMTSDSQFKKVMKSLGFYQGREQPRFYVWTSERAFTSGECERNTQGWFIMGGDSDGELLQAARESWSEQINHREQV